LGAHKKNCVVLSITPKEASLLKERR